MFSFQIRIVQRGVLAAMIIGLVACSDKSDLPLTPDAANTNRSAVQSSEDVDAIARAVAVALADPTIRRQLLEDLRDSPFRKHGLHLRSYLRGNRGMVIAAAAAQATGMRTGQWLALEASLPELELSMPRSLDRVQWRGTENIVVFGTTATLRQRAAAPSSEVGYTINGEAVEVPVWGRPAFPFIAITPAERHFGPDPEATRRAAPRQSRNTITTQEGEQVALMSESTCDPTTAIVECDEPISGGGGSFGSTGIQLLSEFTLTGCTTNLTADQDRDQDRVLDTCEYELANAFRPRLAFDTDDDNTDREPYWTVARHPTQQGWMRIFYLPAYREDGGTPNGGFYAHQGDSEFIIIDVEHLGSAKWALRYATLSAHWQKPTDDTATYGYDVLEFPETYRGRPRVWVAEDKHANYRSKSVCDSGAWYADNCNNGRDVGETLEILQSANIGNSYNIGQRLLDRVTSRRGFPGVEYLWTGSNFRGWLNPSGDAAGPYSEPLVFFSL
jgi:hypothetical protein